MPWRCNTFPEAKAKCKKTCGDCGCFDTTERFVVSAATGIQQSCAWVKRRETETRCAIEGVRFLCPITCGACAGP